MKCTAIAKKINNVDTMFSGVPQYDEVPCNGEMVEAGNIGIMTSAISPCILYQCESCKTIKLC